MRRILSILFLMLVSMHPSAFAGNFYIGPSLFAEHITGYHSHVDGIHPRLSAGYGSVVFDEGYYLAAEIFAVPASLVINDSHSNLTPGVEIKNSFGISILPGIVISDDVLGFLRLGAIQSRFSGIHESKTGGQVGAGLQTQISRHWDLRGEFIYTQYKSSPAIGTPRSRELGIGFTYQIC